MLVRCGSGPWISKARKKVPLVSQLISPVVVLSDVQTLCWGTRSWRAALGCWAVEALSLSKSSSSPRRRRDQSSFPFRFSVHSGSDTHLQQNTRSFILQSGPHGGWVVSAITAGVTNYISQRAKLFLDRHLGTLFFLTLLFDGLFFFLESNRGPHWMVQRAGFSPRAIIWSR